MVNDCVCRFVADDNSFNTVSTFNDYVVIDELIVYCTLTFRSIVTSSVS
ncbi:hypothetical protein [Methanobrevibacter sp.]